MSPEREPQQPSLEAWTLQQFGFSHLLDVKLTLHDRIFMGRNFLEAYPDNSPYLEHARDTLEGFRAMSLDDPRYAETKRAIGMIVGAHLYEALGDKIFQAPEDWSVY